MSGITYFGTTDFRGEHKKFGIRDKDRLRHVYIIGKTGVGKSTLLENMLAQDILNGNGCAFLDPHGASAEKMLDYVPEHRINDVVYFAPFDTSYPISFNIMEDVGEDSRHHIANGILSVMKKIWVDAFSGRMEYILQNTLLALMEYPGATLLGINRMLTDKEYRKLVIDNISDPSVKAFWVDEYLKWDDRYRREAGASIQNKVGQFTSNPLIRNIVGQEKSSFDVRDIMDNKKILIANFSKGLLGEQNAKLLGSMLSTKIYLSAMSRAELSEEEMAVANPFYLYVDEFQNFANDSFADVLSEARKYKLSLIMAHQYVEQMPETVRDAIFGNVGTMIVFRIGPRDAEEFAREFAPVFVEQDFTNLGFAQIYLRLMIDGLNSQPFSARTLPPIETPAISMKLHAFQRSRDLYSASRESVEAAIESWFSPIPSDKELQHQDYLAQKKAEIEAAGGEWVDFSKNPDAKENYDKQKEADAPPKKVLPRPTSVRTREEALADSSKDAPQKDSPTESKLESPKKESREGQSSPAAQLSNHAKKSEKESRPVIAKGTADELKSLLSSLSQEGSPVDSLVSESATKETEKEESQATPSQPKVSLQKPKAEVAEKNNNQAQRPKVADGHSKPQKKSEKEAPKKEKKETKQETAEAPQKNTEGDSLAEPKAHTGEKTEQQKKPRPVPMVQKPETAKKHSPKDTRQDRNEKPNGHKGDAGPGRVQKPTQTSPQQQNPKQNKPEQPRSAPSRQGKELAKDSAKNNRPPKNNPRKYDSREAGEKSKDSLRAVLERARQKQGKPVTPKKPDEGTTATASAPRDPQKDKQGSDNSSYKKNNTAPAGQKNKPATKSESAVAPKQGSSYNQGGIAPQRTQQPAEVPLDILRDILED